MEYNFHFDDYDEHEFDPDDGFWHIEQAKSPYRLTRDMNVRVLPSGARNGLPQQVVSLLQGLMESVRTVRQEIAYAKGDHCVSLVVQWVGDDRQYYYTLLLSGSGGTKEESYRANLPLALERFNSVAEQIYESEEAPYV